MKKYALVSVYNKEKIAYLCKTLQDFNISIISTGLTSSYIKKYGFKSKTIHSFTKFKELLNGRVKTIHPKIHASLLFDRKNKKHIKEFNSLNFPIIDFVIVNLYPFEKFKNETKEKSLSKYLEMIDIGGPNLLRSAAKNFKYVTVISDIKDYKSLKNDLTLNNGSTSIDFRKKMAAKVFSSTSKYDNCIADWLDNRKKNNFPLINKNRIKLKYGENPHQKSYFYYTNKKNVFFENIVQGNQISYNNILDVDTAFECLSEFTKPTCVIIKHSNPCGVASSSNINKAFTYARNSDPISAFGGIVGLNKIVNEKLAINIIKDFYQIVIAPKYTKKSLKILSSKKNLILIKSENFKLNKKKDLRSTNSGYVLQDRNKIKIGLKDISCVSHSKGNANLIKDLLFAFKVCKFVKSNAIVLVKNSKTIGIGAGQMSRVESTKLAIKKIKNKKNGFVAASDAFFPFSDNIKLLIKNNCKAIIQPKGSINDKNIIKLANKNKITLYFSKYRFFRH
tara:strand:+ start:19 stop:1536 length:1518 start_codon:yes stop_codon:yes gene_type:complete